MSQSLSLTSARRSPTTARGPRIGVVVAVLLHAAIVAATLFTFQHTLDLGEDNSPVVPVDLVTVSEKNNVAPTIARVEPQPAQPVVPPPPDLMQPQATPEPQAPDIEVAPTPAPAKPTPKPKSKSDSTTSMIDDILDGPKPANARPSNVTQNGTGDKTSDTVDMQTALKNQIRRCWTSPPTGVPNADKLIPVFRLFLSRDGRVPEPPQLSAQSQAEADQNLYMKSAVEAARRAIYQCQPYSLPANKYGVWRDITITFDPRKMLDDGR